MKVYAGTDLLAGREIRFRKTCQTEQAAPIELGRLLAQAAAGRAGPTWWSPWLSCSASKSSTAG